LLNIRERDRARGIPVTSQIGRLKREEAREDLLAFHNVNGRDTERLEARIKKHLAPYFASMKMSNLSAATSTPTPRSV
jgi:hypothetical protein